MEPAQETPLSSLPFPQLSELPQPPKKLFVRGSLPDEDTKLLTIVGSRKYTPYGKAACEKLIEGLRGYDVSIVSGLALGVDTIAHTTALNNGLHTIAIPGSGLDPSVLYPATNKSLADTIVSSGGTLLSEFEPDFRATRWTFPQRNRIMAGIAHATLVIEATERSGTLITARLCTEYNRDLMVVPGSIFTESSRGSNGLIKLGATPVQTSADILEVLGIEKDIPAPTIDTSDLSADEKMMLEHLAEPLSRDELARVSGMPVHALNTTITLLEIKGFVREQGGKIYTTT